MTWFADELRNSEGEKVLALDRRDSSWRYGVILAADTDGARVTVRFDHDGQTALVAFTDVQLVEDEDD